MQQYFIALKPIWAKMLVKIVNRSKNQFAVKTFQKSNFTKPKFGKACNIVGDI